MTDSPCEICGEWPAVHTDEHLSKVCLPGRVRSLYLQLREMTEDRDAWIKKETATSGRLVEALLKEQELNRLNDGLRKALAMAVSQIREHNNEYSHVTSKETLAEWEALSQAEKR